MTVEEFASHAGMKKSGRFYVGRVPGRQDKHPSLVAYEKDGWIKVRDYAGGSDEKQILAALGLKNEDLRTGAPTETVHTYTDRMGIPLFAKRRRRPGGPSSKKEVVTEGANGEKTLSHLNGELKHTLYSAKNVAWAVAHSRLIYVAEGEPACALITEEWRECATCQPHGAGPGKWTTLHTNELAGAKEVVIIADRDAVGEAYAKEVYTSLLPVVGAVRVVSPKCEAKGDDAEDHIAGGYSQEDLVPRPDLMPQAWQSLGLVRLSDVEPVEVSWLWKPWMPRKHMTLLEGDSDVGKSYLQLLVVAAMTNGRLPNGEDLEGGPINVLLLASEDEADDTLVPRLAKLGADRSCIFHESRIFPLDADGIDRLESLIRACNATLVIIDPILSYVGAAVNINAANEVRPVFAALRSLYSRLNVAGWHVRHHGKSFEGKSIKHMGIGSVDIRAVHRSQMVVQWHPDVKGLRLVTHEKHNMSEAEDPFGFEFKHDQLVIDWNPPDVRIDGVGQTKIGEAISIIRTRLARDGYVLSRELGDEMNAAGISERTYNRARKECGVDAKKFTYQGEYVSFIPSEVTGRYNPFADT